MSRARAWLEIMRISNAPTVLSNAVAGAVLGGVAVDFAATALPRDARWIIVLAPLLCYLGGMVLNDAFDAAIDARERPARPIPSGRISRRDAFVVGALLLAGGIGIAALSGSMLATGGVALLALLVVAYDAIHALTAASIALLALCRALAALIPMVVFARDLETIVASGVIVHPAALAAWTLGLSFLARGEVAAPAAFPACPSCGHTMLPESALCTECGKSPNPAITQMRSLQRRLGRTFLRALFVGGILVAFVEFLPQEPVTFSNFSNLFRDRVASIGVFFLAVAIVVAYRAAAGPMRTPQVVGVLIALLAAIDGLALAAVKQPLAIASGLCFVATLFLQRRIAGS